MRIPGGMFMRNDTVTTKGPGRNPFLETRLAAHCLDLGARAHKTSPGSSVTRLDNRVFRTHPQCAGGAQDILNRVVSEGATPIDVAASWRT
jgi:hypothetical protein